MPAPADDTPHVNKHAQCVCKQTASKQTLEKRTERAQRQHGTLLRVLADGELHVEKRNAAKDEHDEVRNEEGTCTSANT